MCGDAWGYGPAWWQTGGAIATAWPHCFLACTGRIHRHDRTVLACTGEIQKFRDNCKILPATYWGDSDISRYKHADILNEAFQMMRPQQQYVKFYWDTSANYVAEPHRKRYFLRALGSHANQFLYTLVR